MSKSKNNNKKAPMSTGKIIAIALTGVVVASGLATGVAYKTNPDGFKNFFNVGIEQNLQSDNTKVSELQAEIDVLKTEKSELESALAEYKASLDAEIELTAEQQAHIQELESAISEKDTQISTLESLVEQLQTELDSYKTNSVEETLKNAKTNSTHTVKDAVIDGDDLLLCLSGGIEWQSISTGESKILLSNPSGYKGNYYKDSNDTYWLWTKSGLQFGYFDNINKDIVKINTTINSDVADCKFIENETFLGIVTSNKLIFLNKTTKELVKEISYTSSSGYLISNNNLYICNTNFVKYDLLTMAETIISESISSCKMFELSGKLYLSSISSSTPGIYRLEDNQSLTTLNSTLVSYNLLEYKNKVFAYNSNGVYILDEESTEFVQDTVITSGTYRTLQVVNGYLFDKYFSYVFDNSTGTFKLCRSSATNKYSNYLIHKGLIITTLNAEYFNEETLMFTKFNKGSDAVVCENIIKVGDNLFGGYYTTTTGSVALSLYGLHYIDLTDMTYKKVPVKNGVNGIVGFNFTDIRMLNEKYLLAKSTEYRANYGFVIVDIENFEIVYSLSGYSKLYNSDNTLIAVATNGDALSINLSNFETTSGTIKNIPSNEYVFKYGDRLCLTNNYNGWFLLINPTTLDSELIYGVGGVEFGQFRVGLSYNTNYASTIFDTETGDSIDIEGITSVEQIKTVNDVSYLIGSKTVYWN